MTTVQFFNLIMSALICCAAMAGYIKQRKFWFYVVWFLYGAIGVGYYIRIYLGYTSHELSITRSAIQAGIVAAFLWFYQLGERP